MKIVVKGMDTKPTGVCPQGFEPPVGVAGCFIEQTSMPVCKGISTLKAGSDASSRQADDAASLHVDSLVCCSVLEGGCLGHVLAQ